ncbi:hypothetical protein [Priestia koreensis]|uniref:hypothetical protein n=1 Tax=Priestia koreensis TaxID=284581 RepID=UPI00203D63CF|nr:hypothetical protein [Priestia koreensis]MCM3005865.1 hypothetical protein [Priestia koreensis]
MPIKLSPEDEERYIELRDNLRYADTLEEVHYHKQRFEQFKQELKNKGYITIVDLFTKEEMKLYTELQEELDVATSHGEIDYYAAEIRKLFNQVRLREKDLFEAEETRIAKEEIRLAKDESSATEVYAH